MATSLSARRGVVTRQCKALAELRKSYANLLLEVVPSDRAENEEMIRKLNSAQVHLRTVQASLERAMYAFTEAVDKLEAPLNDEERERVEEHVEKASSLLLESEALVAQIEVRKQESTPRSSLYSGERASINGGEPFYGNSIGRVELPRLPIPEFSGKSWQWDNFWELFNATVHSLPISNLQKFNYLLKALKGEARQSAERYQVTSENYPLVLEHLQKKYGTVSSIVSSLHERLEKWTAQSSDLRDQSKLFDSISSLTQQLESKGENLDSPWLLSKVLSKFRDDIRRRVLEKKVTLPAGTNWSLREQMNTIESVLRQEEEIERHMTPKPEQRIAQKQKRVVIVEKKKTPYCFYCECTDHWSTSCTKLKLPKERIEHLKRSHRCLGCGSKNHAFSECKSKGCIHCGKKHHSSICFKNASATPFQEKNETKRNEKVKRTTQNFSLATEDTSYIGEDSPAVENLTIMAVSESSSKQKKNDIFLLTGVLKVMHPVTKELQEVEVLLDTGADKSFIDANLADELQLPHSERVTMKLTTFGSSESKRIQCSLTYLDVWDEKGKKHTLRLFTHNTLTTNLKSGALDKEDLKFIRRKHIHVCSATGKEQVQPKILLGCDQLWAFINFEAAHYSLPSGLLLIPTRFGYMLSGQKYIGSSTISEDASALVHSFQMEDDLQPWEQYWDSESQVPPKEFTGPEKEEKAKVNKQVLQEFNDTIQRRSDGYYVRIPFKTDHDELPDNRALAWKRLKSILQTYADQPLVLEQYDQVFKDQLQKGILEEVHEGSDLFAVKKHYLSHLPVFTPHKETTKFRVVFDASAHYKNCPSLNDVTHQGPTMLPKLYSILLRFRIGKYVLLSDVEKAFLQVRLQERDRDYTRCLWVKDINKTFNEENLVVYRFTRVTFGINASPFLLSATILFHLKHFVDKKDLAEEIAANLYVDNLFTYAQTKEDAIQKYTDLKEIFSDLQMNLREFIANSPEIMDSIAEQDRSSNKSPKVLGLPWESTSDQFKLNVVVEEKDFVSKRVVAQQLASIYDPLGWYIPLLVQAKRFQQQLWKRQYDWDEPLDQQDKDAWLTIIRSVSGFTHTIPRRITDLEGSCSLVTYTDASILAMAACTYLSTENVSHLVMAKSKVSDAQKETTIPKLELNALTIGTRLSSNVLRSLLPVMHISRILILSDSEIALKWISSPIHRSNGVFVANRVKEIRRIMEELATLGVSVQFGYIETTNNPADCGTRGVPSKDFATHKWWTGYALKEISEGRIMRNIVTMPQEDGEEIMESVDVHAVLSSPELEITDVIDLQRFSSLTKAKRSLAYALRFLKQVCSRVDGRLQRKLQDHLPWLQHSVKGSSLSAVDILDAHHALLRNHQMVHINTSYRNALSKNLNLKEDNTKLLRTYGRLNKSDLDPTAKNPIFIAPHTELARLVISDAHGIHHRSTAHTMSEVRQRYWIPRLREQVKKCIHQCVPCQKANNLPFKYPEMTDIPRFRVTKARPFQHIGLDYFGPLTVFREDMMKFSVHGCIFTCAVTRMLHLELVPDGTTEKFLNAFRRFVARRGKPDTVTCDNAPMFLLASQILNESTRIREIDEEVEKLMSNEGIQWHHITPYSPWKGGFYERLIKSVKTSMYKTIGRRILTMEQLRTLLTEVEACLNTRPLTYQETDYEDNILSLRPIDFIQNGMTINIPFDFSDEDQTDPSYIPPDDVPRFRTRLQVVNALKSSCALTERFWKVWRNFYLTALREQHRRNFDNKRGCSSQPSEGEVVLIMDPCQKRAFWKLGRIQKLIHSSDGTIREVEVSNGRNSLRRPINQLVPLEIHDPQNPARNNSTAGNDELCEQQQEDEKKADQKRPRYNLRRRSARHSPISTEEATADPPTVRHRRANLGASTTCLQLFMAVIMTAVVAGRQPPDSSKPNIDLPEQHLIECRPEGVYLHSPSSAAYELCVNDYCVAEHAPPIQKVVHVPTRYLLHDYEAQWKIRNKGNFSVIETTCPAQPFCGSIKCTFCLENVLNPECWPTTAIIAAGVLIYLLIALCYTICYVPMTIGRPLRLLCRGTRSVCYILWSLLSECIRYMVRNLRRQRIHHSRRLLEALAVCGLLTTAWTCQTVNVFSHELKNCVTTSGRTLCSMEIASILKVNSFKREACIRLQHNNSTAMEIRFDWIGLRLLCQKRTMMYTRNVVQKIVDSKRCARMGSCVEDKCAGINSTSMLEELSIGNSFPGTTYCLESCGGLGCGCLTPSSGCLLYRVYAVPADDETYELFNCVKWQEEVKLKVQVRRHKERKFASYVVGLRPNVPIQLPSIKTTLSVLSWQYFKLLEATFVRRGNATALWTPSRLPLLQCSSKESAKSLQCFFLHSCDCTPAEIQVTCRCENQDIAEEFHHIQNVLPVTYPFVKIATHPHHDVMANIDHGITAELVVNVNETVDNIVADITDEVCHIANTHIYGCYSCKEGARAMVKCLSSDSIFAQVDCGVETFTVPCSPMEEKSTLRFLISNAQVQLNCSVTCGKSPTYFEINGILKYVHSLHDGLKQVNKPAHNVTLDFDWPDLGHILQVYLQWDKTAAITLVFVGLALLTTYLYLAAACKKILCTTFRLCLYVVRRVIRLPIYAAWIVIKCLWKDHTTVQKMPTKTL